MAARLRRHLSIAHRFGGRSWRDALCAVGFHVWGLDFHGFGESDPYPEMTEPAGAHPPLGRAADCSRQLEAALRFICERQDVPRVSIIAHSWGTIVAGAFAGRCPELVGRLVFFGPIACPAGGSFRCRSNGNGSSPTSRPTKRRYCRARISTNGASAISTPSRRAEPARPPQSKCRAAHSRTFYDAWASELAYDPARVCAPVGIVRGEWDGMCPDADARWLFDALSSSAMRRDVKIGRATHLMHLEQNRFALYREAETFLSGGDLEERPPRRTRPTARTRPTCCRCAIYWLSPARQSSTPNRFSRRRVTPPPISNACTRPGRRACC